MKEALNDQSFQEGAVILNFQDSMKSPALVVFNARFTTSPNEANRLKGTIKIYAEVVNNLKRRYRDEAVIAKTDEEIRILNQRLGKAGGLASKLLDPYFKESRRAQETDAARVLY